MNEVELLVDSGTLLGECPVWDVKENVLYWIDIDGHKINCYDPSSCNNETRNLPFKAGSLAIRKQGGLLLAMSNGFYNYDFKTKFWNPENVILSQTGKTIGSMTAVVTQLDVSGWEA